MSTVKNSMCGEGGVKKIFLIFIFFLFAPVIARAVPQTTFSPPVIVNGSNGPELLLTLNNWKGGMLTYATNLNGPWFAASPTGTNNQFLLPIYQNGPQYFYRAQGGLVPPASAATSTSSNYNYTRFYATTSFWNVPISSKPTIDPNSAAMVKASLTKFASNATFNNNAFGVSLAYASRTNTIYKVPATVYSSDSAVVGKAGVPFPIPAGTLPATGGDGHLVVVYQALDGSAYAGKELDLWQAKYNPTKKTWSASTVVVNDLFGWGASCPEKGHCAGADAAGFALMGGAVRPEEIGNGIINHALAIATPYNRSNYIACPATGSDGRAPAPALPEGALIQLDPTYNVDGQNWPQWVKVIAHALQTYGAYNRDDCSNIAIYGVTDQNLGVPTWTAVGVPEVGGSLNMLPWASMRVIKLVSCN